MLTILCSVVARFGSTKATTLAELPRSLSIIAVISSSMSINGVFAGCAHMLNIDQFFSNAAALAAI